MAQTPLTPDEALKAAAKRARRGDSEGARRIYDEVLRTNPGHKKAKKALKALQGGSAGKPPPLTEADLQRLDSLRRTDRAAARREAARLCKAYPDQPALQNLHGVILVESREPDAAARSFRHALSLEPGFGDALNNLAACLDQLNRHDEALQCYEALLGRIDRDPGLHFNHANALRRAGRTRDAIRAYRRAIELRPFYHEAHGNLGHCFSNLGDAAQARACYENALEINGDFSDARLSLADSLYLEGRYGDARTHYARVLEREHDHARARARAQLGVANCLVSAGDRDEAVAALERAIALAPDAVSARHLLAALRGEQRTRAPGAYTRAVFDGYADRFEQHLTEVLGYDGPTVLRRLLGGFAADERRFARALDLGCGTGLAGVTFADLADEITGIDLSPRMLARAAEKGVYTALHQADAVDYLNGAPGHFDLAVCADTLPYLGDLQPLFAAVHGRLNEGGLFLCTTELGDGDGYALQPSARFAHSDAYLRSAAEAAGLHPVATEVIDLRREHEDWLRGGAYCLQKR